ncbi:MAG: outer spore coat protein CotE [Bacilli bacterium]|nr:outer spore coat protein CotE [Bacilli bacterium]
MAYFKEIVTKAVVGKGKKATTQKYTIVPDQTPNTVLGCWIINHKFNGSMANRDIYVNGAYDVNVWYSYDNDTKTGVCTGTFTYNDKMNVPVSNNASLTNNSEVIVSSLSDPNVIDVGVENGAIKFSVRKEMGIEIVGDTKIRVNVEDNFEDYMEIIDDEEIDDVMNEIDSQIKEDYLDENSPLEDNQELAQ